METYWVELRFAVAADSLEAAGDRSDELIEAAEKMGFTFELGHTTSEPPIGGLGGENTADAP